MQPELLAVLAGLQRHREPGWNFPAHFLDVSFDELDETSSRLSIEPGPHCIDETGQMHFAALALLADIGMASCMRQQFGMATRMATVAMHLQFMRARRDGMLTVEGRLDDMLGAGTVRQGLTRAEVRAEDGALVCTATGSFVSLGNKGSLSPLPTRRRGEAPPLPPLSPDELEDAEIAAFERAKAAAIPGDRAFLTRFWDLLPVRDAKGATCDFDNGLQVGNRSGHTQGGISFTLGAFTANEALGEGWEMVSIGGAYIAPGTGARLKSRAIIVHQGRSTAVVRSTVTTPEGRTVIETTSNHSRLD